MKAVPAEFSRVRREFLSFRSFVVTLIDYLFETTKICQMQLLSFPIYSMNRVDIQCLERLCPKVIGEPGVEGGSQVFLRVWLKEFELLKGLRSWRSTRRAGRWTVLCYCMLLLCPLRLHKISCCCHCINLHDSAAPSACPFFNS